jgi:uncharacterized protein YdeI (YjbR/CyaY-like superfamily)
LTRDAPQPRAFSSPDAFRAWLAKNHGRTTELLVRCYKSHARDRGMTYPQAVDEALCFGWIDGVRRQVDADSFSVRFTPRRPKSIWSAVNIRRAGELEKEGRMQPPGLAAFRARERLGADHYSFESRRRDLDAASTRTFRANAAAWADYQSRPPWYRRTSAFWVMSAKKDETRARRLALLISCSERGTTIPQLTRAPSPASRSRSPSTPARGSRPRR